MRGWARLAAPLLLSACYTYTPLSGPAPRVGSRVSAQLSETGTAALTPYLGPNLAAVEGRVLAGDMSAITFSVMAVESRRGEKTFWKRETVTVPRALIVSFEERRFSRAGTALLGGAFAVGMIAAWEAVNGLTTGGGTGGGGGPPRD